MMFQICEVNFLVLCFLQKWFPRHPTAVLGIGATKHEIYRASFEYHLSRSFNDMDSLLGKTDILYSFPVILLIGLFQVKPVKQLLSTHVSAIH